MGFIARILGREERSNPFENPSIPVSANFDDWLAFMGVSGGNRQLPHVTIESALEVPAVLDATTFLSRTLAALPLHAYRRTAEGAPERLDGDLQMVLNEAPNPDWSSFEWRRYCWQQVFTGGRGPSWIERSGSKVVAIWPMDPGLTTVVRRGGRKFYRFGSNEYPAADVIDVPFMLKANQLEVYGPIAKGAKAIALAIAMNDFAGSFFSGGGVPPLALEGPLPSGVEGLRRAHADIQRSIKTAKESGLPFFGMPPGHTLKAVGSDPDKGQMTEARLFQIQEIARIYGLPPVFLQDLSKGTFANTEQQDLQLVKHLLAHWAKAFEDELNLKLFGQRRRRQYVEHNLAAVERGDFKTRTEGYARGIQTGQLTPDEVRALENRAPRPGGDKLYIQGATVPIEMAGKVQVKPAPQPDSDNGDKADDGDKQAD
jgi:HK97 family phage portal protein